MYTFEITISFILFRSRMTPVVPLYGRSVDTDIEVGGYHIPANVSFIVEIKCSVPCMAIFTKYGHKIIPNVF